MDVICPEYPGYGIYSREKPSEEVILEDAAQIIRNAIFNLGYKEENIFLIGRSLGTSVAVQMGTIFQNVRGIVLISPFRSIQKVVERTAGKLLGAFAPEIFCTEDHIEFLKCPVLFIHGMKDKLVPWEDSQYLHERCRADSSIVIHRDMAHNDFDLKNDVFEPMTNFLVEKLQIKDLESTPLTENWHKASVLTSIEDMPYLALAMATLGRASTDSDAGKEDLLLQEKQEF